MFPNSSHIFSLLTFNFLIPFVNDFKEKYLSKINENIFEYSYDDLKAILILKTSIKDLEILSMNSQNIITCNGPITQLAGSFNINVIDILEEKLKKEEE